MRLRASVSGTEGQPAAGRGLPGVPGARVGRLAGRSARAASRSSRRSPSATRARSSRVLRPRTRTCLPGAAGWRLASRAARRGCGWPLRSLGEFARGRSAAGSASLGERVCTAGAGDRTGARPGGGIGGPRGRRGRGDGRVRESCGAAASLAAGGGAPTPAGQGRGCPSPGRVDTAEDPCDSGPVSCFDPERATCVPNRANPPDAAASP
jgi:hypothetical protein